MLLDLTTQTIELLSFANNDEDRKTIINRVRHIERDICLFEKSSGSYLDEEDYIDVLPSLHTS